MGRVPCCEHHEEGLKKGAWTSDEDQKLVEFMRKNNGHHGSWRTLPKLAGLQRCGKSCRLRWTNYLNPEIKRGNFTPEEDRIIIQLHGLFGNRWSFIASHLPRRTDNEVKNHWHTHLKKRLPKLLGIQQFLNIASAASAGGSATNLTGLNYVDSCLTGPALMQSILRHLANDHGARQAPITDILQPKWLGPATSSYAMPAVQATSSSAIGRRSWMTSGLNPAASGSCFKDQLEMKAMASSLLSLLGGNNNSHTNFADSGNINNNSAGIYRQDSSNTAFYHNDSSCNNNHNMSESFNLDLPDELFDVSNSGSSHSAVMNSDTGVAGMINTSHHYHDNHYLFADHSHSSRSAANSTPLMEQHNCSIRGANNPIHYNNNNDRMDHHPQTSASCSLSGASSSTNYHCRSGSSTPDHQTSAASMTDEPIILSELFNPSAAHDGGNQWASLLEKTLLLDRVS